MSLESCFETTCIKLQFIKITITKKSQNCDGKVKSSKFKAREFRVIR